MIEQIQLGKIKADFLHWDDFMALCKQWIDSSTLHHVVTLNPEMVILAEQRSDFEKAVNHAQLRVPDGAGLIWAQWYMRSPFWSLVGSLLAFSFRTVERITGVDTVMALARLCAEHNQPLYLLGGASTQVSRTAAKLTRMAPHLITHVAPDHRFDPTGPAPILTDIAAKRPAVILVAYGAPNQTLWITQHRSHLETSGVRIAVGVGGAFAILSEELPRAPRFLRRLNLEWLWRLLLEPSRLPRIWTATVRFPLLIAKQKKLSTPLN